MRAICSSSSLSRHSRLIAPKEYHLWNHTKTFSQDVIAEGDATLNPIAVASWILNAVRMVNMCGLITVK